MLVYQQSMFWWLSIQCFFLSDSPKSHSTSEWVCSVRSLLTNITVIFNPFLSCLLFFLFRAKRLGSRCTRSWWRWQMNSTLWVIDYRSCRLISQTSSHPKKKLFFPPFVILTLQIVLLLFVSLISFSLFSLPFCLWKAPLFNICFVSHPSVLFNLLSFEGLETTVPCKNVQRWCLN